MNKIKIRDKKYNCSKMIYHHIKGLESKSSYLKMEVSSKDKVINDLLSRIAKLEYEVEELNNETEILTNEWLKSQEKRRKAIEYLEQPNRDNFDFSKARLIEILGSDKE